jgi:flagellar basal-body rod protein FlgB
MGPVGDVTSTTIEHALRGLSVRADVRADNLANANTPGFRAGRVDFESTLRSALADGEFDETVSVPITVDPNLPGPNQNLVSVEGEMVGMLRDQLLRNAMVNAYNFKVNAYRTAIGSR